MQSSGSISRSPSRSMERVITVTASPAETGLCNPSSKRLV
jgi:hypothetical protein